MYVHSLCCLLLALKNWGCGVAVEPSIGSARAKVLFAIDGSELKVWGERDDHIVDARSRGE